MLLSNLSGYDMLRLIIGLLIIFTFARILTTDKRPLNFLTRKLLIKGTLITTLIILCDTFQGQIWLDVLIDSLLTYFLILSSVEIAFGMFDEKYLFWLWRLTNNILRALVLMLLLELILCYISPRHVWVPNFLGVFFANLLLLIFLSQLKHRMNIDLMLCFMISVFSLASVLCNQMILSSTTNSKIFFSLGFVLKLIRSFGMLAFWAVKFTLKISSNLSYFSETYSKVV